MRRAEDHPRVLAALATGDLPESVARILCHWINRLPEDQRDLAEEKLVAAALAGMSLPDLAELYGEIYEQARSASPDEDQDEVFDDRAVRLITGFKAELPAIYGERAAAVVVFVSAQYVARDWTRLERRAALNRAVRERGEYVLPAGLMTASCPGCCRTWLRSICGPGPHSSSPP